MSRTVRSCRATTHADLATLKEPAATTYYCKKHGKICKPIFSINGWWQRYTIDTLNRLKEFDRLRTETFQICLTGDSRTVDIYEEIKKRNSDFAELLLKQKIKGIFSSPPYVGLIDYHEQHAYAYEIFGFDRKDELEIGPLSNGQGKEARDSYIVCIAEVLKNCKNCLQKDYDIFLVANDKFNLYPDIAQLSDMKIVNQFKRPVLNRVEKDRSNAYAETKNMPFHYRLLGRDRMALFSFIRSLNTTFGTSIFEPVAETLASLNFEFAQKQYVVGNTISEQAQSEIRGINEELLNCFERVGIELKPEIDAYLLKS